MPAEPLSFWKRWSYALHYSLHTKSSIWTAYIDNYKIFQEKLSNGENEENNYTTIENYNI